MGHGIKEHDIGFVKGNTWHGLKQYRQLDRAVSLEEALSVFDYEKHIRIVPNVAVLQDGNQIPSTTNSIVRTDVNAVLNGGIGNRYRLLDMTDIVKLAWSQICEAFSDESGNVEIESVGTFDNGAIQFLSIVFDTYKVHGDDSDTCNRLMTTNDYSGGGVLNLFSQVRTVCKNTRGYAISQGIANGSIRTTKHTSQVTDNVKQQLIDMAILQQKLKIEKQKLDYLATAGNISADRQDIVLDYIMPVPRDEFGNYIRKGSRNINKRDEILQLFNDGQEGLDGKYAKTPYAFYQSITNVIGREEGKNGTSSDYDNVAGRRAYIKEKALKKLVQLT